MAFSDELSIAVPASFVSDTPHLREKTYKVGLIGRAAAIFKVREVVVYPDLPARDQTREIELISSILSYMETPQYLRRYLFRLNSGLRYVGILPPLRTTHHPTSRHASDLRVGDLRDGVVVGGRGAEVDIGVDVPARLTGRQGKLGERVTVRVVETGRAPRAVIVDRREIGAYWGYRVEASKLPLGAFIRRRDFDLVVATSKHGQSLADVVSSLRERWRSARRKIVAFGSPNEGLREILSHENLKLEDVADFTVNTVPGQGTETVRTEEAVYISLAGLLSVIGEKVGS